MQDLLAKSFTYRFYDKVHHAERFSLADDHPLRSMMKLKSPVPTGTQGKLKGPLPSHYSLAKNVRRILNQGDIGACVSHSAAQAVHILFDKRETDRYSLTKLLYRPTNFSASRLYIYDNARRIDGTPLSQDAGTTNYSGCLAIEQYKVCSEETWPYHKKNALNPPPHDAYVEASKFKTFSFTAVDRDIEDFKLNLSRGSPIMIGIVVFPSFIQSGLNGGSGDAPMPHEDREAPRGGHSILVIGYNNESKRFLIVNCWGEGWGNKGFGSLPYDFVLSTRYSGDFFAIEKFE